MSPFIAVSYDVQWQIQTQVLTICHVLTFPLFFSWVLGHRQQCWELQRSNVILQWSLSYTLTPWDAGLLLWVAAFADWHWIRLSLFLHVIYMHDTYYESSRQRNDPSANWFAVKRPVGLLGYRYRTPITCLHILVIMYCLFQFHVRPNLRLSYSFNNLASQWTCMYVLISSCSFFSFTRLCANADGNLLQLARLSAWNSGLSVIRSGTAKISVQDL